MGNTCFDNDLAVGTIEICRVNGPIIFRRNAHIAPEHATFRNADANAIWQWEVVGEFPHVFTISGCRVNLSRREEIVCHVLASSDV